jgi:glucose uptake protein GlcU
VYLNSTFIARSMDAAVNGAAAVACEACGWAAALCSMLAFGTFGVPIKSKAAVSVDIDPLVFQTYKTFMCFATSWLVLLAGEPFTFTPWGIVSGLFWVPGGTATIFAVKNAGLAIGIGIGSSFIVLVSFIWGIFVFEEAVHSKTGACLAIFSMMLGLLGMSYFSSPESAEAIAADEAQDEPLAWALETTDPGDALVTNAQHSVRLCSGIRYRGLGPGGHETDDNQNSDHSSSNSNPGDPSLLVPDTRQKQLKLTERTEHLSFSDDPESDLEELYVDMDRTTTRESTETELSYVIVCGKKWQRRHLGMVAAMFCGVWGGSIMAPMKFCQSDTKGTHFLLSFSIGASIVNTGMWLVRYGYNVLHYQSCSKAYASLPSFHLHTMWLAGGLSGMLWSIGNFFSLISVFYLGQGVGYPLVQTSIIVSGLWGIFYFKEITGFERISKWLASSLLTIFGILLLGYEHVDE